MKAKILHESAGRIRVRVQQKHMTLEQADLLEYYFRKQDGIKDVQVFDRTCDVIVRYTCARSEVIAALGAFSYAEAKALDVVPDHTGRALGREYEDKIAASVLRRNFVRNCRSGADARRHCPDKISKIHPSWNFVSGTGQAGCFCTRCNGNYCIHAAR